MPAVRSGGDGARGPRAATFPTEYRPLRGNAGIWMTTGPVCSPSAVTRAAKHLWDQRADSTRAMTEHRFDDVSQLGECAVIFDDFEVRVIAEPAAARRFVANTSMALAGALGARVSAPIGQHNMAHIMGRPLFDR